MTTWEPGDDVEAGLRALRVHDADPDRIERIRDRCVAALAVRRGRSGRPVAPARDWRTWLEPAFALGLSALYLAEAVTRALAVYR